MPESKGACVNCIQSHCHLKHEDCEAFVESVRPAPRVCEASSGHATHCHFCAYICVIFNTRRALWSVSERVSQDPSPSRDDT
jgi:hypothetical protein